jgi:hypothetical protein
VRLRSPLSPILSGLRVISEDRAYFLLDFGSPLVVKLKSLKILFNLGESSETEEARGDISVGNSPCQSQLGLRVAKLFGIVS